MSIGQKLYPDKVIPITESGCHIWIGADKGNGYGNINYKGKNYTAHRLFYILENGQIDDDLDVCHSCDVRSCVNPNHLFEGSRKDNMQDCADKNRQAKGFDFKHTKISAEQVNEIAESKCHARELTTKYNLSIKYIQRIQNHGKRY